MKSSTKDKIKGTANEAKGKVQETAGKASGDRDMEDRGTMEKAGGVMRSKREKIAALAKVETQKT